MDVAFGCSFVLSSQGKFDLTALVKLNRLSAFVNKTLFDSLERSVLLKNL